MHHAIQNAMNTLPKINAPNKIERPTRKLGEHMSTKLEDLMMSLAARNYPENSELVKMLKAEFLIGAAFAFKAMNQGELFENCKKAALEKLKVETSKPITKAAE